MGIIIGDTSPASVASGRAAWAEAAASSARLARWAPAAAKTPRAGQQDLAREVVVEEA